MQPKSVLRTAEESFFAHAIDFFNLHKGRQVRWADLVSYLKQQHRGHLPYSQTSIASKLNSHHFRSRLLVAKLSLSFIRTSDAEWTFGGPVTKWPRGEKTVPFGPPPDRIRTIMFHGLKLRSDNLAG